MTTNPGTDPTPEQDAEVDEAIAASRNALWVSALNSPARDALLPTKEERQYAEEIAAGESLRAIAEQPDADGVPGGWWWEGQADREAAG